MQHIIYHLKMQIKTRYETAIRMAKIGSTTNTGKNESTGADELKVVQSTL